MNLWYWCGVKESLVGEMASIGEEGLVVKDPEFPSTEEEYKPLHVP
jgi:hypothetical protein